MDDKAVFWDLRKRLEQYGQGHLLAFWNQLDERHRSGLAGQIERLDLQEIERWVDKYIHKWADTAVTADFEPPSSYGLVAPDQAQRRKYSRAIELGEELLAGGRVAAFVVAGGQGTRLGLDGPKGDFPVSAVKGKTLFRLFAEKISATGRRYGVRLPWYVMTSPMNYEQTVAIFRSNGFYGLPEEDVFIFQQGTLPNFGFDGRILLADKALIARSPDGHGGSLKALHTSGALEDMRRRAVELISYFQVDNPLVKVFDPLFIGLHRLDGAEMSSKALIKAGPAEKVGNFCLADGKVRVIEYSDLPNELAEKRRPDGSLVYNLGNPAIHMIDVGFVERLNKKGFSLPLHRAVKKIAHIDMAGRRIEPTEPNGVKLERFVFDALPLAKGSVILEIAREQEFAPVKNAGGTDSPDTSRQLMVNQAADWLQWAGVKVPRKSDGSLDCVIEISPGFAMNKEQVRAGREQIPAIKAKDKVYLG